MKFQELLSESARAMRFSAIRRMSAVIERPGIISFAPGQPSPETFPVADFDRILKRAVAEEAAGAFQYILTRGYTPLLEAVADYARHKGMDSRPAERMLTEGSQQGLDLVSRVLIDPGDVVLCEAPSYVGALSAFRAARARMVSVQLDEQGLDLEDLRRQYRACRDAGHRVKFLYVVPNYQNPSGITHTLERRAGLLEVAHELDLLVVEDDPYGDVYFDQPPPPTLRSLDHDGRVLYLSSFSKILAPALRTAFVLGPETLLAKLEIAKQAADLCGSGLSHRVVLACLREGLIDAQKERIRPYYRDKCKAMLDALAREMPEGVSWTHPTGGLFVWLRLPEGRDAEALLEAAVAEGVAYVPGSPFFAEDDTGLNTMRLTFAREDVPKIEEGVRRLARAIRA